MASGQVARPEHCGPVALPPCTTPLPEQPGIGASPLTRPRRNNTYEHCQNNTTNRPEAVLAVLASRYGTIDGHRVHALDPCDVAVREAVMLQTTPTDPAALASGPDTPGPLAVATPTTRKLADASISVNTRRAYAGALRRLDAWRGTAPVDDASLAVYLGTIFEAGRAPATAALAVAAVRWADVTDARDGDGVLLTVRTSKTNQEGDAADVRYLKNGAAKAIRTLRAADADAAPTDRVIGLSPLQIQRRFTAAARAAGIEARVTAHSGRVGLASRTDGARRVHHGSHAGRQLENRPHGRALLGRRHRRTRGRRQVFVKAGTGGRQHYDITTTALRQHSSLTSGMNAHCRVTGSRTVEPQQHHSNTTALRSMVPPRRHGCLFVLLARRVSDRAPLVSRGVRHVRQILNPLRDIRHAPNRRDVHAERPSRPEKVRTIIRRPGSHAPAW